MLWRRLVTRSLQGTPRLKSERLEELVEKESTDHIASGFLSPYVQ
jgi:hypothetical protein